MGFVMSSATAWSDESRRPSRAAAAQDRPQALAQELSERFEPLTAEQRLASALAGEMPGPIALVSSFGADSAVLLHMVSEIDRDLPVLFLETEMLFPETLAYQQELASLLKLTDVRLIRPDAAEMAAEDPDRLLNQSDTDACCDLRKTRPLERALTGFGASISGRKRHQASTRAAMAVVEAESDGRFKLNPLADWSTQALSDRRKAAGLPPHPLVAKGYPSIGCAPCTTRVAPGEDLRAGRWRGSNKTECGIHFVNGRLVRRAG